MATFYQLLHLPKRLHSSQLHSPAPAANAGAGARPPCSPLAAAAAAVFDVYKMCKDVHRCVQEKNGAAIKEFFDVYKMCTDVYGGVFFDVYKMCTDVYKKKMAPPLRSFLMCTTVQDVYKMCTD